MTIAVTMFSSLLPKPKHTTYDDSLRITLKTSSSKQVLVPNQINTVSKRETAIQSSYQDTIPLKVKYPNLKHHFPRTYDESTVQDTKATIDNLIQKLNGNDPNADNDKTSFVNYNPSSSSDSRVIQIKNYKEDPMLPPKFKLRKNRHKDPSPPPPILKNDSNLPKLTKEDRAKWNIPSAISNWKNNLGYTIDLNKRVMAANGGMDPSEASPDFNLEKFSELSSALENADKQARDEIKLRNELLKEQALQNQAEKEQLLKNLAEKTRSKRSLNPSHSSNKKSRY